MSCSDYEVSSLLDRPSVCRMTFINSVIIIYNSWRETGGASSSHPVRINCPDRSVPALTNQCPGQDCILQILQYHTKLKLQKDTSDTLKIQYKLLTFVFACWHDFRKSAECIGKYSPEMHKTVRMNGQDFVEKMNILISEHSCTHAGAAAEPRRRCPHKNKLENTSQTPAGPKKMYKALHQHIREYCIYTLNKNVLCHWAGAEIC